METQKKPEILAPVGSVESMRAAVNAGCDAIYIGGSRFGARAYADNPGEEQLREVIRYCHRYGVRVYMTVNTLLKQRELTQELYPYMTPFVREGLDAAIVQDIGVMRYLHEKFPALALHASTQMTLTMGESAEVLRPYGVTRLVPARELTGEELTALRHATALEVEVFVHGALCYCYSGQCLFSSMLGGRSGNRGRCAQPCRQRYQRNGSSKSAYLLSPKEHCSLTHLGELFAMGVDSLKLEGRMKRPEYVALTTAIYRKYTDLYQKLGNKEYQRYLAVQEQEWKEDLRRLAELYNRQGFTSGYFEGEAGNVLRPKNGQGTMLAVKRPNHGGVCVGTVTAVDRYMAVYRLEKAVHAQDVVEFRGRDQQTIYEYTLGRDGKAGAQMRTRYQKGCDIQKGDRVYRTKDASLLREIRETYLAEDRKIPVWVQCDAVLGKPLKLTVSATHHGKMISVAVEGAPCRKAQKRAVTPEELKRLCSQSGGTVFAVTQCAIALDDALFLAVGEVKRLRREAFAQLQEKLEHMPAEDTLQQCACETGNAHMPDMVTENVGDSCETEMKRAGKNAAEGMRTAELRGNPEKSGNVRERAEEVVCVLYDWQAKMALETGTMDAVYLRTEAMEEAQIRRWILAGQEKGIRMYLMMPAVFRKPVYDREKKLLQTGKSLYQMPQLTGFVIRNMESFVFLTREARVAPGRIRTDAGLYVYNTSAAAWWREQGAAGNTLPLELTGKECAPLCTAEGMEAILYGRIPLMITAQCIQRQTQGCMNAGNVPARDGRRRMDARTIAVREEGQQMRRKPGETDDGSACCTGVQSFVDQKKREFSVFNACKYCYNIIYHGLPLSLGEEKSVLREQGIQRFRYDLTLETPQQAEEILRGRLPEGQKGHFYRPVE